MKKDTSPQPQPNKSLTSSAASQMKRAFGLQSSGGSTEIQRSSSFKSKKSTTISDILRAQMRISENSETRTRRALSRATAGQVHLSSKKYQTQFNLLFQLRNCLDRVCTYCERTHIIPSEKEFDNVSYVGYSLFQFGLLHIHIDWNSYYCYRRESLDCAPNACFGIFDWQDSPRLVFFTHGRFTMRF